MSLRWKIALILAAVAAGVGAIAATGAYVVTAHQLQAAIDDSLVTRAAEVNNVPTTRRPAARANGQNGQNAAVATAVDGTPISERSPFTPATPGAPATPFDPSSILTANGCPPAGLFQPAAAAQLVSAAGDVTACIAGAPAIPTDDADLALATAGGPQRLRTVTVDGQRYRVLTTSWRLSGAVMTARRLDEVDNTLADLRTRFTTLAASGVAAAALLGWLTAKRMVRPIERLRTAAESIATTQDLSTEIPESGNGEVGSLAASFTTMVQALATSREQQHRLIADASHELRTPLTSLRTNIELLDRAGRLPEEELGELTGILKTEAAELTHLVTELVELATDRSSDDEPTQDVHLLDLATEVANRARRRTGRPLTLTEAKGSDDLVSARPLMIERAIANLVDNANKYSDGGLPIELTVDGGQFSVRDRGPGIEPDDLPLVFERFYRAPATRSAPGSGLGLAIVKQIVERHGGTVFAENHADGGAVVGFRLPTAAHDD
ncbi:MAG: ATP-binding protein [Acidimicrobiia bacterium]